MKKKMLAFTITAMMVGACMVPPLTAAAEETEVVVGISADPMTLEPFQVSSTGGIATMRTVYECLIYTDGQGGEALPCLAKEWEYLGENEGLYEWQIELFEGITDSAGAEYTASDVKWYLDNLKETGTSANTEYIENIEVVDDYTFIMSLNVSQIGVCETLLGAVYGVTQESYEAHEAEFSKAPITTSPYKVTSYTTGSEIVLEKREDYWQKEESQICKFSRANVDKITFKVITDANQMDIAMQNGEVDVIPSVASADLYDFLNEDLTTKDGYYAESYLRGATLIMFFNNHESNVFSNEDLRKACAYAIDTNAIVSSVLNGQGTALVTAGSECFGDFEISWYDEEYYGRDGVNLEKAQEHLANSGFDTSQTIRILTETDNTIVRVAQIIQSYLMQLGMNVEIESYETALYEDTVLDPSAWDIFIGYRGAGDYLANLWRWTFDTRIRDGYTANFVADDELQGYLEDCLNPEKHTAEDMTNFKNCLNEHCYVYGLFSQKMYVMADTKLTDIVFLDNWAIQPGACSYNFE